MSDRHMSSVIPLWKAMRQLRVMRVLYEISMDLFSDPAFLMSCHVLYSYVTFNLEPQIPPCSIILALLEVHPKWLLIV